MAEIQERPAMPIVIEDLDGAVGQYDGESIVLDPDHVKGDDVSEVVDTIVHEGRHAYQDHLVQNPEAASDLSVVSAWDQNMQPGGYVSQGQEYFTQPIEADAWDYAGDIKAGVFGDKGDGDPTLGQ
jgi:hypothetical protein